MFKAIILKAHGNTEPQDQSAGLHKSGWEKTPVYLAAAIFGFFLLFTIHVVFVCFPEIWGGTMPASFIYSLKDLWGFVLIFAASCFFVWRVSKSSSRTYSQGEKIREMLILTALLILVIFVNPIISQPLEKFQLFTISTILLTGVLIFFWLIVLVMAGIYQLEYKAIYGTYFHGRGHMSYNRK